MSDRVRRLRNLGGIVSDEIVLDELATFLAGAFPGRDGEAVLDLGAGEKPYEPLYRRFAHATTVDVPFSPHDVAAVDVLASADALPLPDAAFDCVICTEVLEHCPDPRAVMREVFRVLRPGGKVFLTTPFQVPLHEMPYDFFRYTPPTLERMALEAGFEDVEIRAKGDYFGVLITVLQLPVTKTWQAVAKLTRLPLYSARNPIVWATVVAPQLLYAAQWKRIHRSTASRGFARRVSDKLGHYTLGFVTTMTKPSVPPTA